MKVRLVQLDGKLPNLALMRLAAYHRDRGDVVHFTRSPYQANLPDERDYDRVYGSAIFSFSADRVAALRDAYPGAIIGGTWNTADTTTVEDVVDITEDSRLDYTDYPKFDGSIGFTARGCRLKCGFCVVPKKEGKPRSVNTIADIWRGSPYPRHLHLLDNDFFGQPEDQWRARLGEIRAGGFKVCLNQGINTRMIDAESAAALASVDYRDDGFKTRTLYTAWDNLGDEQRFLRGVDILEHHGVPAAHLLTYMLIGYDKRETWGSLLHRFWRMAERGVRPFPMLYGDRTTARRLPYGDLTEEAARCGLSMRALEAALRTKELVDFQRWAIRRRYMVVPFAAYERSTSEPRHSLAAAREQLGLDLAEDAARAG